MRSYFITWFENVPKISKLDCVYFSSLANEVVLKADLMGEMVVNHRNEHAKFFPGLLRVRLWYWSHGFKIP